MWLDAAQRMIKSAPKRHFWRAWALEKVSRVETSSKYLAH